MHIRAFSGYSETPGGVDLGSPALPQLKATTWVLGGVETEDSSPFSHIFQNHYWFIYVKLCPASLADCCNFAALFGCGLKSPK